MRTVVAAVFSAVFVIAVTPALAKSTAKVTLLDAPAELLWQGYQNGTYITAYGGPRKLWRDYPDAKDKCSRRGERLISILDDVRSKYVAWAFSNLLWIGLNCSSSKRCTWLSGSKQRDKTLWLDGEPAVARLFGSDRTCGAMLSVRHLPQPDISLTAGNPALLRDSDESNAQSVDPQYLTLGDCDIPRGFLCNTTDVPDNADWTNELKKRQWSVFRTMQLPFKEALAYCRKYNGTLMQPKTRGELELVRSFLLSNGYWIGIDQAGKITKWEDGSKSDWGNWEADSNRRLAIYVINGQTVCAKYDGYTGEWAGNDCSPIQLGYLCQTRPRELRGLQVDIRNATYTYFIAPLSFSSARDTCQSIGADLAVLGSWQENREVACRAWTLLRGRSYYVGHFGTNHTLDGSATYSDRLYFERRKGTRWSKTGCMMVGGKRGGRPEASWLNDAWWPVPCTSKLAFVCKKGTFTLDPKQLPCSPANLSTAPFNLPSPSPMPSPHPPAHPTHATSPVAAGAALPPTPKKKDSRDIKGIIGGAAGAGVLLLLLAVAAALLLGSRRAVADTAAKSPRGYRAFLPSADNNICADNSICAGGSGSGGSGSPCFGKTALVPEAEAEGGTIAKEGAMAVAATSMVVSSSEGSAQGSRSGGASGGRKRSGGGRERDSLSESSCTGRRWP